MFPIAHDLTSYCKRHIHRLPTIGNNFQCLFQKFEVTILQNTVNIRSFYNNLTRISWEATWLRRSEQIIYLPKLTNVATQLTTSAFNVRSCSDHNADKEFRFVVNV